MSVGRFKLETLAIHAGTEVDPATSAVTPPIHLSTTFERAPDGSYPHGYVYTRSGNPNRAALERLSTALEGGLLPPPLRQARLPPAPFCEQCAPAIT